MFYATFNLKKDSRGCDTFEYLKKTTKQINFITAILKRDVVYLNTFINKVVNTIKLYTKFYSNVNNRLKLKP